MTMGTGLNEHTLRLSPNISEGTFHFEDLALITLSREHYNVHAGNMFHAMHHWTAVADDATAEMLFAVGDSMAHMQLQAEVGGDTWVWMYEGTTVTGASGTAISANCMNRMTPSAAQTKVFYGPEGISATGDTLINRQYLAGGIGPQAPGGGGRTEAEWILSANQNYLVRMVNKGGQVKPIQLIAEFYEHD